MGMRIEQFDYALPKELIAQQPAGERTLSRLFVLKRQEGGIEHRRFKDIGDYLRPGDVIVLNDTKVLPARLRALKPTGGRVEILMVEEQSKTTWSCLVNGVKKGVELKVLIGSTPATIRYNGKGWEIEFAPDVAIDQVIRSHGHMPVPPYIRRDANDSCCIDFDRYQTVYAERLGSIAAPTAGLHFSPELLENLEAKGIIVARITLHIGTGTFFLIKTELVEDHDMHREWYRIGTETVTAIRRARARGGRVVAVGTSAVRTLETFFSKDNQVSKGFTELFIYPGFQFQVVDMLLTNFHLPRSTPLLLASAFAGKEKLLAAYREAIENGYRFYSYGDAMLIQ